MRNCDHKNEILGSSFVLNCLELKVVSKKMDTFWSIDSHIYKDFVEVCPIKPNNTCRLCIVNLVFIPFKSI